MALAGIGTNLCLALVAAGVLKVVTTVLELPTQNLGVIFFGLAFYLNVILALFNALPFPGFDGFNFLTTFSAFGNFISKTPLGDPLFMVRYGLLLSLALLYLFSTTVSRLIIYVLAWLANFFGITDVLASVLTYF